MSSGLKPERGVRIGGGWGGAGTVPDIQKMRGWGRKLRKSVMAWGILP